MRTARLVVAMLFLSGALAGAVVQAQPPPLPQPALAPPTADVLAPDLDPAPAIVDGDAATTRSLVLSAAGTAGIYAVLYGWLSMAWYVRTTDADHFAFHDEGWFGPDTYAGGADKLGHLWGNYAMTRGVSQVLQYGGWGRRGSIAAASGLSLAFFTISEVKDGYKVEYGFSWGDVVFNTTGVALGAVLELVPALDRRVDLRMGYVPSGEYLARLEEAGPFNTPEDYSGQTMLLAYHLGSIDLVRRRLSWVRYLDLNLGYATRNYLPLPDDGAPRAQDLFVGVSLNVQEMLAGLVGSGTGGSVLGFMAEIYQPPLTTVRVTGLERTMPQPVAAAR